MKREAKQAKLSFSQSSDNEVPAKRGKPTSRSTTPTQAKSTAKKQKVTADDLKNEKAKLKAMQDSLDEFKK